MTFLVLSLPRSRSTWLSRFLSYREWSCGHDELRHMRSLDDVKAWFAQDCTGTAETAAAPWWRLLPRFAPEAKIVLVRRPVREVVDSLMWLAIGFDRTSLERTMTAMDRKLDQIAARLPNVLSVAFADLAQIETCAQVFEHCLPYSFDEAHWARWNPILVQSDLPAMLRYVEAYRPALEKLGAVARHRMLADLSARPIVEPEGVTIQAEPFESWVRDGTRLFDEHLIQVGEAPGDWTRKNLPLMRRLYEAGAMQIVTARSNGRMFGYLMTIIGPSLTSETVTMAAHTTFYASDLFPGLGMKLQRAALAELKRRGVDEVHFQAGVRGGAERIGAIYRRLGAENAGQVYRLQLGEH